MIEWVAFIGLLVGVVCRVVSPYLRKIREKAIETFDFKFLYSAIATVILCLIVSILAFPLIVIPVLPNGLSLWFLFGVFATNFAVGWGANDIINEVLEWRS